MEFIGFDEAVEALRELGIDATIRDDRLTLEAVAREGTHISHLHLADGSSANEPRPEARVISVAKAQLSEKIDAMIGQLHLSQVLLLPVGKWRDVFDAVAFSLADNEDWQEVDTMATVELNTRDPLLCQPADYHTVQALIDAIFADAEGEDQGITIVATATPFIAEVIPDGAVRVTVGSDVLADEIQETVGG